MSRILRDRNHESWPRESNLGAVATTRRPSHYTVWSCCPVSLWVLVGSCRCELVLFHHVQYRRARLHVYASCLNLKKNVLRHCSTQRDQAALAGQVRATFRVLSPCCVFLIESKKWVNLLRVSPAPLWGVVAENLKRQWKGLFRLNFVVK